MDISANRFFLWPGVFAILLVTVTGCGSKSDYRDDLDVQTLEHAITLNNKVTEIATKPLPDHWAAADMKSRALAVARREADNYRLASQKVIDAKITIYGKKGLFDKQQVPTRLRKEYEELRSLQEKIMKIGGAGYAAIISEADTISRRVQSK